MLLGPRRPAFRQQAGQGLLGTQAPAEIELDESEDQERQPDDADQGLDAVVVMEKDGAHA